MVNLIEYLKALTTRITPIKYGGTGGATKLDAANSLGIYSLAGNTVIPTNSDLNNYTTPGNYYNAGGSTMTLTNSPIAEENAFYLKISKEYGATSNYIQQELTVGYNFKKYYRRYDGTSWTGWVDEVLDAYPIGSVYISYEPTSPAELFGGTWTSITGVFPYFNAGTTTGGSNTHTLTVSQIPSHTHDVTGGAATGGSITGLDSFASRYKTTRTVSNAARATGGSGSHNNMPAYQTFYAWRRTE